MKTKEELDVLKKDVEALNQKLAELNEEELKQVIGATAGPLVMSRGHFIEGSVVNDFTPI